MELYNILNWFKRNLCEIILSQRKTLGYLVYGLLKCGKVGVAAIGRGMESNTTARHNIKRVARYLENKNIKVSKTLINYQKIVLNGLKTIYLIIDWTLIKNRGYQSLVVSIISDGRAIPLFFKTYKEGEIYKQQTKYEILMLDEIKKIVDKDVKLYIIGDRGFGQKPELIQHIDKLGFYYVERCKDSYYMEKNNYKGKMKDYSIKNNSINDLKDVIWPNIGLSRQKEKSFRLKSRLIFLKKDGYKERWILCTNDYESDSYKIILIYGKRMNIEQSFKDKKNLDRGFCFEKMRLSSAERYDRMLLLICFAYLFLTLLGKLAENNRLHKKIMPNTVKYRSISLFQVGKYYFLHIKIPVEHLLNIIQEILYEI